MSDQIYRVMPEIAPGVFRSRPTGGSPGQEYRLGEWTERVTDVRLCRRGYHTLAPAGLLEYARVGDSIVRCKRRGIGKFDRDKATNERVMPVEVVGIVTERALRLTAADCAESVLHIYAARYPDDPTLEVVIHTARAFAHGGATRDEMAAASDAAWAAAYAAARDAAWAAAYAAAWAAARDAAWAAAYAAAYAAARAGASDAARAAVGAAVGDAARAGAWDAALAAASDAAWAAASDAAWVAAGQALLKHAAEEADHE